MPSCSALVQGGYFSRRGSSSRWDTLTSAQQLLKGMLDAHGPQLKKLPMQTLPAPHQQQEEQGPNSGGSGDEKTAATAGSSAAATPGQAPLDRTVHDLVVGGLAQEENVSRSRLAREGPVCGWERSVAGPHHQFSSRVLVQHDD